MRLSALKYFLIGLVVSIGLFGALNAFAAIQKIYIGALGGNSDAALVWDTTGHRLGINTTTPSSTVAIQGSSTAPTLDILRVASSSRQSYLTVAANGSTTISSLISGFVKTTATGALYTDTASYQPAGTYVTSVDMTVPTGLSISGNPITTSGTLALSLTSGYVIPLTASTTQWNSFYNFPLQRIGITSSTVGSTISITTTTPNLINFVIPTASALASGQLSSTDWSTFNGKQSALSFPLAINLGGTGTTSAPSVTGQLLSANGTGWGVANLQAGTNITITTTTPGLIAIACPSCLTANQTITLSGVVTGSGATAIATILSPSLIGTSTVGNGITISTTTTQIILNIPTASASLTGQLSSTDWSTFNNKQATITNPVTGTGAINQISYWTSSSAQTGSANFLWLDTPKSLRINTTTLDATLGIQASSTAQTAPLLRIASSSGISFFQVSATGNASMSTFTANTLLQADGGKNIQSTALVGGTNISITTSTPQLIVAALTGTIGLGNGGTGATSLTDHGVLVGSGAAAIDALGVGTNGQILVGSSAADPVFATLNCAGNLTCTTGAGTLQIDVDDSYLFNTGDVGTGVYDFGGATSFEIPNDTGGAVDTLGEIGVDTTNSQFVFYTAALNVLVATSSKSMTIETPTASESITFFTVDQPITITGVLCSITSGSSNIPSWTFSLPHSTNRGSAAANAMSSGQACTATTTPQQITIGGDLTLAAGEVMWATSSAVSIASSTNITIFYKYDRQ